MLIKCTPIYFSHISHCEAPHHSSEICEMYFYLNFSCIPRIRLFSAAITHVSTLSTKCDDYSPEQQTSVIASICFNLGYPSHAQCFFVFAGNPIAD